MFPLLVEASRAMPGGASIASIASLATAHNGRVSVSRVVDSIKRVIQSGLPCCGPVPPEVRFMTKLVDQIKECGPFDIVAALVTQTKTLAFRETVPPTPCHPVPIDSIESLALVDGSRQMDDIMGKLAVVSAVTQVLEYLIASAFVVLYPWLFQKLHEAYAWRWFNPTRARSQILNLAQFVSSLIHDGLSGVHRTPQFATFVVHYVMQPDAPGHQTTLHQFRNTMVHKALVTLFGLTLFTYTERETIHLALCTS